MEYGIAGGQRKKQLCVNIVSEKAVGIPVELESIYLTDLGQFCLLLRFSLQMQEKSVLALSVCLNCGSAD